MGVRIPRAVVPVVRITIPSLSVKIFAFAFVAEDYYNANNIISKINNFNDIHKVM